MVRRPLLLLLPAAVLTLQGSLAAKVPTHQRPSDLIFEDNFNSPTLNTTSWGFDLGDGCDIQLCGWGNEEHQIYDNRSSQTGVEGSYLRITARRLNGTDDRWSSAKLTTRGRVTFTYGRVEVRARLPVNDGAFPAIWMLPQANTYGIWPKSGEADVTEYQSVWRQRSQPEAFRTPGSLHVGHRFGANSLAFWAEGNDPSSWHTYALVWRPDRISFELDGRPYGEYVPPSLTDPDDWPFRHPFYLIINLAVRPGWGSKAPPSLQQMTMDVDWIRVTRIPYTNSTA